MSFAPIALTIPEYDRTLYANWWLKAYDQGTTTPLAMATDTTGGTTLAKAELDTQGFPITAGSARFIPFINGDYDLWLFPTAAEADANDTTNAIQFADNLNANPLEAADGVAFYSTVAAMKLDSVTEGRTVTTQGYYASGDGGDAVYLVVAPQAFDGYGDHELANGNIAVLQVGERVNARQFGANPSQTDADNTLALQAAINYTLLSPNFTLYIPAGTYGFTTLTTYDSVSVDERAKRGKIRIIGDGNFTGNDVFNYAYPSDNYGTVLVSSETSNNVIVASNNDTAVRYTSLEDFTLISVSSGYGIQAEYCPEFRMERVSVRVNNVLGSGALIKDAWFGNMHQCIIDLDSGLTPTSGAGVEFGSTLFAGLFTVSETHIDNFYDCVWFNGGANWANYMFRDSALQKFHRYGCNIETSLWNIGFRNHYTESGQGVSGIYANKATGDIKSLSIDGLFCLGGSSTVAWLSGPMLDFQTVSNYSIKNVMYFRPYHAFLNCDNNTGGVKGTVENYSTKSDSGTVGAFFHFTGDVIPSISSYNIDTPAVADLVDPGAGYAQSFDSNGLVATNQSFGITHSVSLNATSYDIKNADPRPSVVVVESTNGAGNAAGVILPNSTIQDASVFRVINTRASVAEVNIRNGSSVNVYKLKSGEGAVCMNDSGNDVWVITPFVAHVEDGTSFDNVKNFTANDATPSVLHPSKIYKTANTAATTITAFDDGRKGDEIKVIINDANTTIDFTGTTLKGNNGVDYVAAVDDMLTCTNDGTNWYCIISQG